MRFLIADDDYITRIKIWNVLAKYTKDCDTAADGEVAFQLFEKAHKEKRPYDLVTLDIEMPGLQGHEVLAKIRGWEQQNKISTPVNAIMITSHDEEEVMTSSLMGGCKVYIKKPVTPEKIHEALNYLGMRILQT